MSRTLSSAGTSAPRKVRLHIPTTQHVLKPLAGSRPTGSRFGKIHSVHRKKPENSDLDQIKESEFCPGETIHLQ